MLSEVARLIRGEPEPPQAVYRMGSLVDAMITQPDGINWYTRTLNGDSYSDAEMALGQRMTGAFFNDAFAKSIFAISEAQKVITDHGAIDYDGFRFTLARRCLYDLYSDSLGYGGDIKTTAATTQDQFMSAIQQFDYDRQRAWYMDVSGSDKDFIIGISRKNLKVFKVFINRGDPLYESGRRKYAELAFRYWCLPENAI